MIRRICLAVLAALFVACPLRAEALKLDPAHSFLVFEIKHMDVGFTWGRINAPAGTINIDDANLGGSSIQIDAKAENIDTGVPARDAHLKRADFFDAKQFPAISFKSTSIKKSADNVYEVVGDLTMHGVTKSVTVTLNKVGGGDKGPPLGYREGYETSFTIKRSDWSMTGLVGPVADDVKLFISIEAARG